MFTRVYKLNKPLIIMQKEIVKKKWFCNHCGHRTQTDDSSGNVIFVECRYCSEEMEEEDDTFN
jgi:transcription elongation factor Elf1